MAAHLGKGGDDPVTLGPVRIGREAILELEQAHVIGQDGILKS
jgi:hypothetical protein